MIMFHLFLVSSVFLITRKYTIWSLVCEASCHHVTQVSRVIQVMLVIQVIQVIQVIRVILVILVIFNTVTHTWTDELTRQ